MNDDDMTNLPQLSDQPPAGLGSSVPTYDPSNPQQMADTIAHQYGIPTAVLPEEAGDIDLIEKEWVIKAKQIVEHTSEDPYTQQAEISRMKADYMHKRYGKDVKITEGA